MLGGLAINQGSIRVQCSSSSAAHGLQGPQALEAVVVSCCGFCLRGLFVARFERGSIYGGEAL